MRRLRSIQDIGCTSTNWLRLVLIPDIGSEQWTVASPLCFYCIKYSIHHQQQTPQLTELGQGQHFHSHDDFGGSNTLGLGCSILQHAVLCKWWYFLLIISTPHGETAGCHPWEGDQERYQGDPCSERGFQLLFPILVVLRGVAQPADCHARTQHTRPTLLWAEIKLFRSSFSFPI